MYKVSVVTPFHNVDMGMFEKCAESMRAQTIGFENIEWIIVVHNCEPKYMPLLTEMFKDDGNVIVKELNDGIRSPAMPRNHGMQFVTAPYLGFLDGDDSYTADCLEVVRREMMETQSQVGEPASPYGEGVVEPDGVAHRHGPSGLPAGQDVLRSVAFLHVAAV